MKKVQTICPYCGTGCLIDLIVQNGRISKAEPSILEAKPNMNHPVNDGELCVKGLYGWEFVHSRDRLGKPLIRKKDGVFSKGGTLQESGWDEALDLIATKMTEVREKYGPDAFMGFSSARATNEENYLFQKLFRVGLQTNNVDHCARL